MAEEGLTLDQVLRENHEKAIAEGEEAARLTKNYPRSEIRDPFRARMWGADRARELESSRQRKPIWISKVEFEGPDGRAHAKQVLESLGINLGNKKGVLVISGGAAEMGGATDKIIAALAEAMPDMLVVDGGTYSGIMQLVGNAAARVRAGGKQTDVLGVTPAEHVTSHDEAPERGKYVPAPEHNYAVFVESTEMGEYGNWGNETEAMYQLIDVAAENLPSVAFVVNGGGITLNEVFHNMDQNRPMVICKGSGRAADAIAAVVKGNPTSTDEKQQKLIDKFASKYKPEMKELFHIVDLETDTAGDIAEVIRGILEEN